METNLNGKLALVTGAESGLGECVALRLAKDGANVILHYVFHRENAERIAQQIRLLGRESYVVCADFSSADDTRRMLEEVQRIGPVDILVNNAGMLGRRLSFLDEENDVGDLWEKSFQINFMAVARTMRALLPGMCERKWGRVVNISSVSCRIRNRTGATIHYTPMKSAVEALTIHVSDEVAQNGVTCNCVGPGNMVTPLTNEAPLAQKQEVLALYHTRRSAQTDEVAATVEYLCSPDASFITGEVIYTSGGR